MTTALPALYRDGDARLWLFHGGTFSRLCTPDCNLWHPRVDLGHAAIEAKHGTLVEVPWPAELTEAVERESQPQPAAEATAADLDDVSRILDLIDEVTGPEPEPIGPAPVRTLDILTPEQLQRAAAVAEARALAPSDAGPRAMLAIAAFILGDQR